MAAGATMSKKNESMKGSGGRKPSKAVKKSPVTASAKANLKLPVGRIMAITKRGRYAKNVSKLYGITVTAILEFITVELLYSAMDQAKQRGRQRVTPRDIMLAIKDDNEFSHLLKDVHIADAGVPPKIHEILMPRKLKNKKSGSVNTRADAVDQVMDGDEDRSQQY